MKTEEFLFDSHFAARFSNRFVLCLLFVAYVGGVLLGSIAVKVFGLLDGQSTLPLLFSGVPAQDSGFWASFSTILLNGIIGLLLLFLFGMTAFGCFCVPVFLCLKGATVSVGVLSLVGEGDMASFAYPALGYTPGAAAASLLLILFAVRAFAFSKGLARAGFFQSQEALDFQLFLRDFLMFLCLIVMISILGGFLAVLCGFLF